MIKTCKEPDFDSKIVRFFGFLFLSVGPIIYRTPLLNMLVSSICAKGHPKRHIKLQNTPRYGAEHGEGEADAQGTGGLTNMKPTTRGRQGAGPPFEVGRGGGGVDGGVRQREEGTLGWENI